MRVHVAIVGIILGGCPAEQPAGDAGSSSGAATSTDETSGGVTVAPPGSTTDGDSTGRPGAGSTTDVESTSTGIGETTGSSTGERVCEDDPVVIMTCEQASLAAGLCDWFASCTCAACSCAGSDCLHEEGCFDILSCAAVRGCALDDCISDFYCGPIISDAGDAALAAAQAFTDCADPFCDSIFWCDDDPNCPDGDIDAGEQCDADDLQGFSCEALGLGAGELACGPDCQFDTSSCGA